MGRNTFNFDWLILITVFALTSCGLFVLLTIDRSIFNQQLIFAVISIFVVFIFAKIDVSLYKFSAPILYIFSIVLLVLVFLNSEIRGASRWIIIGGAQIQPSEFVKPFIILFFARILNKFSPRNIINLPMLVLLFFIPFILVFKQPDLGSSIVYATVWLGMMIGAGLDLRILTLSVVFLGSLIPFLWKTLANYQQLRILSFLNPMFDPQGAGYNALQSTIAVGSGQFFGRGLGMGTQSHLRFLPEYHTDFIFGTLVEELGLIGGLLILILYLILLLKIIFSSFRKTTSLTAQYFGIGIFIMLLTQVFINSGMNMGILPITGITLPFISYGGSSLVSLAMSLGIFFALVNDVS